MLTNFLGPFKLVFHRSNCCYIACSVYLEFAQLVKLLIFRSSTKYIQLIIINLNYPDWTGIQKAKGLVTSLGILVVASLLLCNYTLYIQYQIQQLFKFPNFRTSFDTLGDIIFLEIKDIAQYRDTYGYFASHLFQACAQKRCLCKVELILM